jgi:hypothetical protein
MSCIASGPVATRSTSNCTCIRQPSLLLTDCIRQPLNTVFLVPFLSGKKARLFSRLFLAHRFFGLVRGGSLVFLGGPRKPPKLRGMALGGLPGAPGAPGAGVRKPKNQYFLLAPTRRPRRWLAGCRRPSQARCKTAGGI